MTTDRSDFYKGLHISISGLIGAGKSTLTGFLSEKMGIPTYYEPIAKNKYLESFYNDMTRYAFSLQIHLLISRFKQYQNITWKQEGGISDRTIYEDSIFCKVLYESGHMSLDEYKLYLDMFDTLNNFIVHPDVIIYLDVSPEESLARIHKRNRGMESGITIEYLRQLHTAYNEWLEDISRTIPVFKIDWSEFIDPSIVEQKIRENISLMKNITSINFD